MTALNKQALRSKARSASAGEWIKESGDGWEAICSADDQANGNFIIAHFEGPDAQANREFVQAANPDAVLALLDELEAAEKRIAELEAKLDSADKLQDSAFRHGLQHGFSLGQTDNQAGFEECLSAYGTGKGE
ncbi:ead/Ea22-like family protein [Escherichia coli]|uniref:ead/Ea22-like family protein n=3 Tax=Escherichia coli TaxID=562 RepID=UPI003CE7BCD4